MLNPAELEIYHANNYQSKKILYFSAFQFYEHSFFMLKSTEHEISNAHKN